MSISLILMKGYKNIDDNHIVDELSSESTMSLAIDHVCSIPHSSCKSINLRVCYDLAQINQYALIRGHMA